MWYFEMDSIKEITAAIFGYIGLVSISLELILILMIINMICGCTYKFQKCFGKCCIAMRNYSNNPDDEREIQESGIKNSKIDKLHETEITQLLLPVIGKKHALKSMTSLL